MESLRAMSIGLGERFGQRPLASVPHANRQWITLFGQAVVVARVADIRLDAGTWARRGDYIHEFRVTGLTFLRAKHPNEPLAKRLVIVKCSTALIDAAANNRVDPREIVGIVQGSYVRRNATRGHVPLKIELRH